MVTRVPTKGQPPILLVEDDEDDAFFVKFAVDKAGIGNRLIVAGDGLEAVRYLTGVGDYADREVHPLPGLLLLDLKMPVMSGFEVLTWLKSRTELIDMPVVVLSSSDLEADKTRATSLGAKDYRVKPSGTQPMRTLLKELHARWLGGPEEAQAGSPLPPEEKQQLKAAILAIGSPDGDGVFGWECLCELADLERLKSASPFRKPDHN